MNLNLAGRTVIVTGGGSNIGRGIALAFGKENSNVVIASVDEKQGQKVANQINDTGGKAIFVQTDVTSFSSVTAMVKKALEVFGKIDVLINSAGWVMDRLFTEKPREE